MSTSPVTTESAVLRQLKAERAASGMSIAAVAAHSGIPERTLQRYLAGTREFPLSALLAVTAALGVDFATLVERAREREQ